jgi:hypothetical protein
MAVGAKSPLSGRASSEMFDTVRIVLKQMKRRPSVQVHALKTPFLVNCIVVYILCTNHAISVGKNSKTYRHLTYEFIDFTGLFACYVLKFNPPRLGRPGSFPVFGLCVKGVELSVFVKTVKFWQVGLQARAETGVILQYQHYI